MRPVSFSGSCPARSNVVLVCERITHPYVVKRIHCRFEIGCVNKLKLRFYVSTDADVPSSGPPNGFSILMDYGQVDYILGEGDSKDMDVDMEVDQEGSYLKVYAVNDDYYKHMIDVQMYIEPMSRKE